MAEYYPLLAKAVGSLPNSTPETRRVVYERARKALIGQLRTLHPPVPDDDIEHESVELDRAIGRLESELAQAASKPPVATPPISTPAISAPPILASYSQKPVDPKPADPEPQKPARPIAAARPMSESAEKTVPGAADQDARGSGAGCRARAVERSRSCHPAPSPGAPSPDATGR